MVVRETEGKEEGIHSEHTVGGRGEIFLMIRRPPRSTHCISSAASEVYKRQERERERERESERERERERE